MIHGVEIKEAYKTYKPPKWVHPAVRRILDGLPPEHLAGLRTVVLRDAGGLNHQRRHSKTWSRQKKVKVRECLGLYHARYGGEPAWIELFMDNILCQVHFNNWVHAMQDVAVGETLCHEIGHHIHSTRAPEFREKEDVAEKWQLRLMRQYLRRKYWYLHPVLWSLQIFRPLMERYVSK